MKIAVIFFLAILISVNAIPLGFGGWNTVISSSGTINGVESTDKNEMSKKAEEVIKGLIEKHLAGE